MMTESKAVDTVLAAAGVGCRTGRYLLAIEWLSGDGDDRVMTG